MCKPFFFKAVYQADARNVLKTVLLIWRSSWPTVIKYQSVCGFMSSKRVMVNFSYELGFSNLYLLIKHKTYLKHIQGWS